MYSNFYCYSSSCLQLLNLFWFSLKIYVDLRFGGFGHGLHLILLSRIIFLMDLPCNIAAIEFDHRLCNLVVFMNLLNTNLIMYLRLKYLLC